MILFRAQMIFLERDNFQRTMKHIIRSLVFADKFLNEIKDKNQLQRFLVVLIVS